MKTSLLALIVASLAPIAAFAQRAPLPLGTIDTRSIIRLHSCPRGYLGGMTCFHGDVQNCPNADDLGFTYGYENPGRAPIGTIVFHDGGGGTVPYADPTFAEKYLSVGYQVIFLAWDRDWETSNRRGSSLSIKSAACRPATLFNYFRQNLYSDGGMCVQGFSAGSAATAYSLAWYGSSAYLDNVELLSGPVFSDVEQGCQVPNFPTVNVCATGEYGCNGAEWQDSPAYVTGNERLVSRWTGLTCNQGRHTSKSDEAAWKAMSIVDGTSNPSFVYPQTSMAGYLCSNVNSVQNNSAAEGDLFYQQFRSSAQTALFSVTRIDHCSGTEGVTKGATPQGTSGFNAISGNMISACIKRH